ncbi:hypothetical protein ACHHYP_13221 [Achlya hypogyna]|uniref:Uncharacterized protein n=1 Tax=Achlya hypogyna TaxID=1202772 RepID=A0A1V9ZFS3_ACHHY|nr:hypothetical protein ACHHYP_13221 [Achlya hypogyna]
MADPVAPRVRKLFLETEAAYDEVLGRPFTPQKVRLHPFPHEIDHVVPPRSSASALLPKATSCSRLSDAFKRQSLCSTDASQTILTAMHRSHQSRASMSSLHSTNESVLDEMRAFVAKKRSERKAQTPPTSAKERVAERKMTRGIEVHMQCHLEFSHLHSRATRHMNVHPSPGPSFSTDLEAPQPRNSPFKIAQKDTSEGRKKKKESLSYQKLLRKLSPTITNSATTYINLLHLLQACRVCGGRVTFCNACQTRANEYFHTFSPAELEKTYGKQLPPPDRTKVAEYSAYLRAREDATVLKSESKPDER